MFSEMLSYPKAREVLEVQEDQWGQRSSWLSRILRVMKGVLEALVAQVDRSVLECPNLGYLVLRGGLVAPSWSLLWGPLVPASQGRLAARDNLPPLCLPSLLSFPGHLLSPSLPLENMCSEVPAAQEGLSLPFLLSVPSDSYQTQWFRQD